MVPKYHHKYFTFILPATISFVYLFSACIKPNSKFNVCVRNIKIDATYSSNDTIKCEQTPCLQELIHAIEASDAYEVEYILGHIADDVLNGYNLCLHIAAGMQNPKTVDVMKLLLDKLGPLLLSQQGRESLLFEKGKIEHFLQGSSFWDESNMKNYLNYLEKQGYNNSALLLKNACQETPLLIAAKIGCIEVFQLLLTYTHKCVGLDHTAHLDKDKNDMVDILLAQNDNGKLGYLMNELYNCGVRSATFTCMHFWACLNVGLRQ